MRTVALLFAATLTALAPNAATTAQAILENRCASCHGAAQMSGLDLRQRDTILKGGKRGPALVPGKPDDSLLYRAVARHGDLQMPPGKQALPPGEVARLRAWIEAGAPWESTTTTSSSTWWDFRKLSPSHKRTSTPLSPPS